MIDKDYGEVVRTYRARYTREMDSDGTLYWSSGKDPLARVLKLTEEMVGSNDDARPGQFLAQVKEVNGEVMDHWDEGFPPRHFDTEAQAVEYVENLLGLSNSLSKLDAFMDILGTGSDGPLGESHEEMLTGLCSGWSQEDRNAVWEAAKREIESALVGWDTERDLAFIERILKPGAEVKPGTRMEYPVSLKWEREECKEEGAVRPDIYHRLVLEGIELGMGPAIISEEDDEDPARAFYARIFTYEENEGGIGDYFATLEEAKAFVEKTLSID